MSLYKDFLQKPRSKALEIFVFGGLLGFIVTAFAMYYMADNKVEHLLSLLRAIFTTVLLVGLVELLSGVLEIRKETEDARMFKEFFGQNSISMNGVPAVFPSSKPKTVNANGVILCDLEMDEQPSRAAGTKPKGIEHVIAFEDLEALLDLDREFNRLGAKLRIKRDVYKRDDLPKSSCIVIGLGYNNVTDRLERETKSHLYKLNFDNGTDDFELGDGRKGDCTKNNNYSLIARVVLGTPTEPDIYLVCAGHTAIGTKIACRYLAERWDYLHSLYKHDPKHPKRLNEDSMAVIMQYDETPPNHPYLIEPPCFTKVV